MFQRRALEVLVLLLVLISAYYLHWLFSSDYVPDRYRISAANLYSYIFFIMGLVMYYMSLHHSIMYFYDRMKNKQREKALELRKQNFLMDRLEREKHFGGAISDPYSQAIQQFIISEALTPRTKRKNMVNMPDATLQKPPTTLQKPTAPAPPPPKTILEKMTPKIVRKAPTINDRFVNNNNNNNNSSYNSNTTTPISVHTPQAKRKLLGRDTINQDTHVSVLDGYPPVSLKQIIAELQTPNSKKRQFMHGHTNPSISPDHIV